MNARLVVTLSLLGLLIGIGSVTGIIRSGIESVAWIGVCIVSAIAIIRVAPGRPFRHGFVTGFLGGVLSQLVQVLFFDRYLAFNTDATAGFQRLPPGLPPRIFVLLCSPFVAAFFGVLIGALAWAGARVLRKRTPAA